MGLGDSLFLSAGCDNSTGPRGKYSFSAAFFLAADHRADAVEPGNPAVLLAKTAGCIAYGLADPFSNFHTNTIPFLWGSKRRLKASRYRA